LRRLKPSMGGARLLLCAVANIAGAILGAVLLGYPWYAGAVAGGFGALAMGLAVRWLIIGPMQKPVARLDKLLRAQGIEPAPRHRSADQVCKEIDALEAALQTREAVLQHLEGALRSNEARYRDLFDHNPHPMLVFDLETLEILAANDAATRRYGFSRQQFLRMTVRHLLAGPVTTGVTAVLERMALDHEQPAEDVHRRRDGSVMDVEVASHRIHFAGRSAAVALLSDISVRKQAQAKAQRHLETLTALYETAREQAGSLSVAQVANVVVDAAVKRFGAGAALLAYDAGDGAMTVLAASPATDVMKLEAPEDWLLCHGNTSPHSARVYRSEELPWLKKLWPGDALPDELRYGLAMPLAVQERLFGQLHVLMRADLSYLREQTDALQALALHASTALSSALAHEELQRQAAILEERVRERTAELEAANQELEAFSYSVSHDLRAPLRNISGFARILLRDHGAAIEEGARKYLEFILCGAAEMEQLIQALLSFSRSARQPLHLSEVEPQDLIAEVWNTLQDDCRGRNIEFRVGELPACLGDRTLLKQVFFNLLSNAVKYTGPRNPAVIEVGALGDHTPPVYYVRDNGVGFDPSSGDRVFRVFQRLHSSRDFPGSGVGLATVHRIITRHHGRIWYETEVGRGTTFFFEIGRLEESSA